MTYEFPPDVAADVQQRMASGRYSSEDEVLRDSFRALRSRDQEVAAIQDGIEDMEAGRTKPLREFDREFREQNNISQDA